MTDGPLRHMFEGYNSPEAAFHPLANFKGRQTVMPILDRSSPLLLAALALITGLVSGCSTVRARTEMPSDDWKVYPGIRRDVTDLEDAFAGKLKGPAWTTTMVVPILVGDMPFSTVVDTGALPYDIYRIQQLETPEAVTTALPTE